MKLSIKLFLVMAIIILMSTSITFVTLSSYLNTKNVLSQHAKDIMENIASFSIDKSENHILPAGDAASLTKGLATNEVVSSENRNRMEKYFFEQLLVNSQFSGIYYGNENGEFLMVSRISRKEKIKYLTKSIVIENGERKVLLKYSDINMKPLKIEETFEDKYDPRVRPWYKKAKSKGSLIWTEPYIFFTSQKPGITTANAVTDHSGNLKGVVGVDIEIDELSDFLAKLKIGKTGKAFIITDENRIIAFPDKEKLKVQGSKKEIRLAKIDEIDDPLSLKAFYALKNKYPKLESLKESVFFEFNDNNEKYHAMFAPFKEHEWPWIIGIFLPENDYLGLINKNQRLNIIISLIIGFFAIMIGLLVAKGITKPIGKLEQVSLELKNHNLDVEFEIESYFSEINEAVAAFSEMKKSINTHMKENIELNKYLNEAHLDTLFRLAYAAEFRDDDTAEHIHRISEYSILIGSKLGLSEEELNILKYASIMHDLGKVGIPDAVLLKPGKLTAEERKVIETHPEIGASILKDPSSDIMWAAQEIALTHHEKWDGNGYPKKLTGDEIPLYGQIVAVVDVFDALVSERVYKKAWEPEKALSLIIEERGKHFSPKCVDAFAGSFKEVIEIYNSYNEKK